MKLRVDFSSISDKAWWSLLASSCSTDMPFKPKGIVDVVIEPDFIMIGEYKVCDKETNGYEDYDLVKWVSERLSI